MWKFKRLEEDSVLTDPTDGSFFANNDDSDNLVREAIQNSLDAQVDKNKPVKMKFTFSDSHGLLTNKQPYLGGLKKHLDAIGPQEDFDPDIIKQPMPYLTVEDFNTRGLQGDPDYFGLLKDEKKEDRNDFYWFYRNRGRSGKSGEQRGRWGLGKRVFPQCSSINAFIGYTLRHRDQRKLIMGQCVLKTHDINNDVYDNTGFYSIYDRKPMPIENEENITKLCEDFSIKRGEEPGFSAIIPYPNNHVNYDNIQKACVRHFFYPLLSGELVIELWKGSELVTIDSDSIQDCIQQIQWDNNEIENIEKMIEMTKWSLDRNPEEIIRLNKVGDNAAPIWEHVWNQDVDWNDISEKFREGDKLAFRVLFYIKKKDEPQKLTHFDVFLEQDRKMLTPKEYFVREGLSINAIKTLRTNYIRGLVIINDKPLSTLLGDAEDPSHKDWKEKQEKLKNNYDRSVSSVRFVKNALVKITDHLSMASAVQDKDLIAEIEGFTFSVVDPIKPEKKRKKRTGRTNKKGDKSDFPEIKVETPTKKYDLYKVFDGFKIKNTEDFDGEPFIITVTCAYTTPVGDPYKNYEEFDFILDNKPLGTVDIESEGIIVESVKEMTNRLRITVKKREFKISVTGFDTKRDLEITARGSKIKDEA